MVAVALVVLLVVFLFVPQITELVKGSLDTLPMRFAAVFIILGALSYDKLLALGIFLVVAAIYIQHHHGDVVSVLGIANNTSKFLQGGSDTLGMMNLEKGGHADESYDSADFTAKAEDQDNEFTSVESSIDEKHALITETLGSRAAGLFPDDTKHVNAMEHGNRDGYSD